MEPMITVEEQMQMAQRSAARLNATFSLFMNALMTHPPKIAIDLADEAMQVWIEYEEGHRIDFPMQMPQGQFDGMIQQTKEALGKLCDVMVKKPDDKLTKLENEVIEAALSGDGGRIAQAAARLADARADASYVSRREEQMEEGKYD